MKGDIRKVAAEEVDRWRGKPSPNEKPEPESSRAFELKLADPPLSLEELERQHIAATITWAGGNKTLAARVLGINRRTLHRKLDKYQGKAQ